MRTKQKYLIVTPFLPLYTIKKKNGYTSNADKLDSDDNHIQMDIDMSQYYFCDDDIVLYEACSIPLINEYMREYKILLDKYFKEV